MASFRKARNIIEEQIKDNRLHYPYRVARSYYTFYEAFETRLDERHLDEIIRGASYIARRIESLPTERRDHRDVSECYSDMQRIMSKREDA